MHPRVSPSSTAAPTRTSRAITATAAIALRRWRRSARSIMARLRLWMASCLGSCFAARGRGTAGLALRRSGKVMVGSSSSPSSSSSSNNWLAARWNSSVLRGGAFSSALRAASSAAGSNPAEKSGISSSRIEALVRQVGGRFRLRQGFRLRCSGRFRVGLLLLLCCLLSRHGLLQICTGNFDGAGGTQFQVRVQLAFCGAAARASAAACGLRCAGPADPVLAAARQAGRWGVKGNGPVRGSLRFGFSGLRIVIGDRFCIVAVRGVGLNRRFGRAALRRSVKRKPGLGWPSPLTSSSGRSRPGLKVIAEGPRCIPNARRRAKSRIWLAIAISEISGLRAQAAAPMRLHSSTKGACPTVAGIYTAA